MAIKDPKARIGAIKYAKGRVAGALGLLEEIFGEQDIAAPNEIKIDSRGRRRLVNLRNKCSAAGGKQIIVNLRSGESYQLRYSGPLVDFQLGAVPKMERAKVLSYSTARGKLNYI
jgi:hypothetical protein